MKTTRGLSRKEFDAKFGTNEQCMTHLYQLKWGDGYKCRRCGHSEGKKGKKWTSKRCKACGNEESITSQTLFHKVKFDLHKAFGMIYDILLSKKGASSIWLAERYEVSQNTAWLFRRKVQDYLESSGLNPLTGIVHVDEFEIGTPKRGKYGRAKESGKARVILALEIREGKVDNGYAQVIDDFSASSLSSSAVNHANLDTEK